MAQDNLTAVQYGINDIRLEQTKIEEPGDNDVLIKMANVGICGSDVHYLVHGRIGDFIVKEPMIIGHESAGTVVKKGKNVNNLEVGDRVAIEPGVPCRHCQYCKLGNYNLCSDIVFCATPPVHGTLRRYYKHPADFCYKLPEHVSLEEGALLEPLSVGVCACKKAQVAVGTHVLILGAGPIGLVTLLVAKARGASSVIITDINENRLKLAKELGADNVYLIKKGTPEAEDVENIKKMFGREPDITIDACGFESSIRLAILTTKRGGKVVIVGMGAGGDVKLPLLTALCREVDLLGVFRYVNDYPVALDLVAKKGVDVKKLITHRFTIEQTKEAFECAKSGAAIKVMIKCD